jgi:uncharacterized protein YneF (UPF0154 family)
VIDREIEYLDPSGWWWLLTFFILLAGGAGGFFLGRKHMIEQ